MPKNHSPDVLFMQRCIDLAFLGEGKVNPNPKVGALLVHEGKIIGEGYHQQYGKPHAEINALRNVTDEKKHLIPDCTLYVSLEPCHHHGKTPPCTEAILHHQIKKVVIGSSDPNPLVNGKGIAFLRKNGVDVVEGVLENEARETNPYFFYWKKNNLPFVILKWAETANGYFAPEPLEKKMISSPLTQVLVHQWRSAVMGILVGKKTIEIDDPLLNVRLWHGPDPVRIILDRNLEIPSTKSIFHTPQKTILYNTQKEATYGDLLYWKMESELALSPLLERLSKEGITSVLVEGGAKVIQSFIDQKLWNEARVIQSKNSWLKGLSAPQLQSHALTHTGCVGGDQIRYYRRMN